MVERDDPRTSVLTAVQDLVADAVEDGHVGYVNFNGVVRLTVSAPGKFMEADPASLDTETPEALAAYFIEFLEK